ncbi:MAG TPA: CAP domain-containing protein [Chitinophagaceae bacterium]|nr:CAP domain-containing protein [Chitinophagaceae bacterium]
MKHIVLVIVTLISVHVFGQGSMVLNDKPFLAQRKVDTSISNPLQRQALFNSLTRSGKELVYWVNLMRKDPKGFGNQYIAPFLEQFPEANSRDSKALMARLAETRPLAQLTLSATLVRTSQDHAAYLAEKGMISHTGRGGKSFVRRMNEAGITECAGENIFDGQDDALMVLILLLIDRGVPGAGHREALLNPDFNSIGIGVAPMEPKRMVFVQQFGCQL